MKGDDNRVFTVILLQLIILKTLDLGEWTRRYYYNHRLKRCEMFWFDQSCGHQPFRSRNVFVHLTTCYLACEGINPNARLEESTSTTTLPSSITTIQPFHPHLHKQQHHKHWHKLLPDHHPSITVNPKQTTPEQEQLAYPQSTLATLAPIVRPPPKTTSIISEQKTVGVIQAMFTISKTSHPTPLGENDILEEATGRPLDDTDLQLDDLTNLIDSSPNWNTVGSSIQQGVCLLYHSFYIVIKFYIIMWL
jgi:hypothetical protein